MRNRSDRALQVSSNRSRAAAASAYPTASDDALIRVRGAREFLVPVNLTDESLQIIEDKRRPDTSHVEVSVKVTLSAGDDTKARIAAVRKFIEKTPLVGRTEVEPLGDVGLSIVGPEKYRYDILARIAKENARLAKVLGGKCEVRSAA